MTETEHVSELTSMAVIGSAGGSVFANAWMVSAAVRRACKVVLSDRQCGLIQFAEERGIDIAVVKGLDHESTSDEFLKIIRKYEVNLAVSFYTRLFRGRIIKDLHGQFVNFHPSILPSHPGQRGFEETIENNDSMLGATVSLVDSGMDTGAIVLRAEARNALDLPVSTRRHIVFRMQVAMLIQLCEFGPSLPRQAAKHVNDERVRPPLKERIAQISD